MILTFGSSRRAASQSVETSGSSVADVMDANLPAFPLFVIAGLDPAIHLFFEKMDTRVKPACDSLSALRLLRLDLLDRTAGIAPGREPAAHMRDRLQPHVLRGLGR